MKTSAPAKPQVRFRMRIQQADTIALGPGKVDNGYERLHEPTRSRATRLRVTVSEIATRVIDAHEAIEKPGPVKLPTP